MTALRRCFRGVVRFVGACVLTAAFTGLALADELQALRDRWKAASTAEEYTRASTALIDYRLAARYAKTAEVDYMIATSLCRIPGSESNGYQHFAWILANYDLGADRAKVLEERERCGVIEAPMQLRIDALEASRETGAFLGGTR